MLPALRAEWARFGHYALMRQPLCLPACLVLTGLAACSSDAADRAANPQQNRIEACADVVADPVFQGDAEVLAEFNAPGQPTRCTLKIEAGSPSFAAIGVTACANFPLISVQVRDGAWAVDSAETESLTAKNC